MLFDRRLGMRLAETVDISGDVDGGDLVKIEPLRLTPCRKSRVDDEVDLNTLIPPGTGWYLNTASAMTNVGYISGTGTLSGKPRPFLLIPSQ